MEAREIRFLFDEHVNRGVAVGLQRRGFDVQTIQEAGLRGAADIVILNHAIAQQRVIVTHDPDFLRFRLTDMAHPGIVYSRQRSLSIGEMIEGLMLICEVLDPEDLVNRIEYL